MPDGFIRVGGRMVPARSAGVAGEISSGLPGNITPVPPTQTNQPLPVVPTPIPPGSTFVAGGPRQGADAAVSVDFMLVNRMLWAQPGCITNIGGGAIGNFVNGPVATQPGNAVVWGNTTGTQVVDPGWQPAPIASPTFTGTPTAPTPPLGASSTQIATCAFVLNEIAAMGSALAVISGLPPPNPLVGQLWWDNVSGQLFIYFNDGNSTQWVIANNAYGITQQQGDARYLQLSGGTLAGSLTIAPPSVAPNQIFLRPASAATSNTANGSQLNSFLATQTTGGNSSDIYSNIRADTAIQGSGNVGIWGVLSQMTYNGNGGNGGHVPIYGQFSRRTVNAGGSANNPQIWGAVFEVIDWTNTDSAQTNFMSGIELDMTCGNTDSAKNRRGFGMYLNKANSTDTAPVVAMGMHLAANVGSYDTVLKIETPFNIAAIDLRLASATIGSAYDIWLGNAGVIAMDTSASLLLSSDSTGGLTLTASAGNPARVNYHPGSGANQWWAGAWEDGSFYISDATGNHNRLVLDAAGNATLTATTTVNGPLVVTGPVSGGGFNTLFSSPPAIGNTTPSTGAFTTLSATGAVSGTGFVNRFASPGPIGSTTASTGAFTTINASGAVTLSGTVTTGKITAAGLSLDGGSTFTLTGDGSGGMVQTSVSGQPSRMTFTNGAGNSFWLGSWLDGSFYVSGGGGNRIIINSVGALTFNGSSMGFNNATPIAKPTVTGSKGGNAALASLMTALASYGLVTDSTT